MDAINALLDQYDAAKAAKEDQARREKAAEAQRLDQFHARAFPVFEQVIVPALKAAADAILRRGHGCEVEELMSDDAHFRYRSVDLDLQLGQHATKLAFGAGEEQENIKVSMYFTRDNIKHCSVALEDINRDKVEEKIAIFLKVSLGL